MAPEPPHCFVLDDADNASTQLIRAVGSVVEAEPHELPPLHDGLDPEALDSLLQNTPPRFVSLTYAGFHLSVLNGKRLVLRDPASIHSTLTDCTTVLLPTTERDEFCSELLTPYPPEWENILSISFDEPTIHVEGQPAETGIITVGDFTRSGSASSSPQSSNPTPSGVPSITTVSDPTNLTALRSRIADQLVAWAANANQTVVCFHSISKLLRTSDSDAVLEFLEALSQQFSAAGAIAHYHVDVDACTADELDALESIVDATVEIEDSELRIRT